MTLFGRPDLKDFKFDTIYRNSLTDELVEFIGTAVVEVVPVVVEV